MSLIYYPQTYYIIPHILFINKKKAFQNLDDKIFYYNFVDKFF